MHTYTDSLTDRATAETEIVRTETKTGCVASSERPAAETGRTKKEEEEEDDESG